MSDIRDAVLMHHLGLLDNKQVETMEAAKEQSAYVRHCYRMLDPFTETPEPFQQMATELANEMREEDEFTQRFREQLFSAKGSLLTNDGSPIVPRTLMERLGIPIVEAVLDLSVSFDTDKPERLPMTSHGIEIENNVIELYQSEDAVPYAVVRVIATKDGVPLASTMRLMKYGDGWRLKLPLDVLFDRELVSGMLTYYAVPAKEGLFELFPKADVEALLNDIPTSWVIERGLVEELLTLID
jgi:hypothetical protein